MNSRMWCNNVRVECETHRGAAWPVVQDRALEAEAERMGHRAASSRVNAAPAVAAPGSGTLAGPAPAQRRVTASPPAQPRSHSPVQMAPANKHLKRFLNVVTLGIRIPYVKHKRAVRAAAAAAAQQQQHEQIYHSAVKYHSTSTPNVSSITQHGLLNYKDREDILGARHRRDHTRFRGSEFEGDEREGSIFWRSCIRERK